MAAAAFDHGYAFKTARPFGPWPISGFTCIGSTRPGTIARCEAALALAEGGALGQQRFADRDRDGRRRGAYTARFFWREAVSLLLLLTNCVAGIITGMALNSFFTFGGVWQFSTWDDRSQGTRLSAS